MDDGKRRVISDLAADVSRYFHAWLGVTTAPRIDAAADDESAKMMYQEYGWPDLVLCGNAGLNQVHLVLSCTDTMQKLGSVLAHEYFHNLQSAEFNGRWYGTYPVRSSGPVWLQEGGAHFASIMYLQARGLDSYELQRTEMVRYSANEVYRLRDWIESTRSGSPAHFFLGALAWERLIEKAGDFSLLGYYRNRELSASPEEAFERTFGLTIEEFYEEFEAWRAAGFPQN